MIKNIFAALAIVASIGLSGCSIVGYVNGFNDSWQSSAPQVFNGTLSKDSVPGTYEVKAVPSWSALGASDTAKLGVDVRFSVKIGDYDRTYVGKAVLSARYDHSSPDEFVLTNIKVTNPTNFSEMEPYLYVNIWPIVSKRFEQQLEATPKIVVRK